MQHAERTLCICQSAAATIEELLQLDSIRFKPEWKFGVALKILINHLDDFITTPSAVRRPPVTKREMHDALVRLLVRNGAWVCERACVRSVIASDVLPPPPVCWRLCWLRVLVVGSRGEGGCGRPG